MQLVEHIYRVTAGFPPDEKFGLTTQLRRAAVSAPSNIAEGAARASTADFLRFLAIARGSLSELDTQIEIARRLGYPGLDEALDECLDRALAKVSGLMRALQAKVPA